MLFDNRSPDLKLAASGFIEDRSYFTLLRFVGGLDNPLQEIDESSIFTERLKGFNALIDDGPGRKGSNGNTDQQGCDDDQYGLGPCTHSNVSG